MPEELKDFIKVAIAEIIGTVIMCIGQMYDIPLLRIFGNSTIAMAVSIFGYRNGKRDSEKKYERNNEEHSLDRLEEILRRYFDIPNDTYAYNLTRVKMGFAVNTITVDDFKEFDEDEISDLANYIRKHLGKEEGDKGDCKRDRHHSAEISG